MKHYFACLLRLGTCGLALGLTQEIDHPLEFGRYKLHDSFGDFRNKSFKRHLVFVEHDPEESNSTMLAAKSISTNHSPINRG